MTVSLDPQLEALIAEKIASGRYQSASEVIREALRLLEGTERLEAVKLIALQRDIQAGLDSGEPVPFDKDAIRALAQQKR
jgi:antitoxin ParD1/3/4